MIDRFFKANLLPGFILLSHAVYELFIELCRCKCFESIPYKRAHHFPGHISLRPSLKPTVNHQIMSLNTAFVTRIMTSFDSESSQLIHYAHVATYSLHLRCTELVFHVCTFSM